jgi:hypothetical protein
MLSLRWYVSVLLLATSPAFALPQREDGLRACGEAFYYADRVRTWWALWRGCDCADGSCALVYLLRWRFPVPDARGRADAEVWAGLLFA